MNQEELVLNFRAKDVKAFEKIYEMYHENVLGIVYNIVRSHDIAEELAQDVFVKAWNNAESYAPEKGRFFTWILNIARNTAIDKTRSKNFNMAGKKLDAQYTLTYEKTGGSVLVGVKKMSFFLYFYANTLIICALFL